MSRQCYHPVLQMRKPNTERLDNLPKIQSSLCNPVQASPSLNLDAPEQNKANRMARMTLVNSNNSLHLMGSHCVSITVLRLQCIN